MACQWSPWEHIYSRRDYESTAEADDDVVRDPGPPRAARLDELRAGAADEALDAPLLAAGPEQDLRRAQEARTPRPRAGDARAHGAPAAHRLRHHVEGPQGARTLARRADAAATRRVRRRRQGP